jgi:hypothetical protein
MPTLGLAAGLATAADEASMGEDDVCARPTACSNSKNARRNSINRIVDRLYIPPYYSLVISARL